MNTTKTDWIFITFISMVGISLAAYATIPYGAGVPGDATRYMSTAESLLGGKGFFDHFGDPLVSWPPLYPIVLAGLGFLIGDVFLGGWLLNILLFGVSLFLTGALLQSIFPDKRLYLYIGCLFALLSASSLGIHTNIMADPLLVAFGLGFLNISNGYLATESKTAFGAMILLASLASLQSFLGLGLVATGALLILWKYRNA